MQQESFGRGFTGPLQGASYKPLQGPTIPQFLASSYENPPGDSGQGGLGQGGPGQGGPTPPPPPPPPGYGTGQGGGFDPPQPGSASAPPPPSSWGGSPGYPPPAMPQWSGSDQPMGGTGGPGSLANWGQRFGATIIDGLIIAVVGVIFREALGTTGGDIVDLVVGFLYATIMIGGPRGQTVGLIALGTKVVDANSGQSIGYGRAALRWFIWEILVVAFLIGRLLDVLWPLWDARNQTIHDKAASSLLVRVR